MFWGVLLSLSLTQISISVQDYTMTFYLRRKWVDERLAFTSFPGAEVLELDTRVIDKLWVPDIYFRNEKSASVHNVTVPNRLLHLHKNGTVLYSSRYTRCLCTKLSIRRSKNCLILYTCQMLDMNFIQEKHVVITMYFDLYHCHC